MKFIKIVSSLLIVSLCLTGCAKKDPQKVTSNRPIKIVSTIFPQYDWINQIIGEGTNIDNRYLMDRGIDLHSFQPSAADINAILSSDIFVYVGGESDGWVEDVLRQDTKHNVVTANLIELLEDNVKQEEHKEGMQVEDHHEEATHDTDQEMNEGATHGEELSEKAAHDMEQEGSSQLECDEHVWLSLRNAEILCEKLTDIICEQDPENTKNYQDNATSYIEELRKLDNEYQQMVEQAIFNTIVVADRFPFRYLVDDYGIQYYAAFAGCSAETEASFDTIITLSNKVDEYRLSSIVVTEGTDQKLAQTVINHTLDKDQNVVIMNSIQSVNQIMAENKSYLEMMKENLESLRTALGENQ